MKVSYRNKWLDIISFNIFHLSRSPILLGGLGICLIVIGSVNWQIASDSTTKYSQLVKIVVFVILQISCVSVIVLIALLIIVLSNISKMNKTVLADTVLTLGSAGITSESQYARSELKWDAVQKLARTRSHIFLYIMQHGAIVIPKRAFSTNDEWDQFWLACQAQAK